ncbi:MAG: glycerol-3-phosphate 1-O-acyltransferase PlsY [Acidobacteriaceae bacterium]|nr:glycerol-3-phosphate 1-O-acyltransferase PlsY [Acidobacteriaceae bacterium]MBV9503114.1 glycerol-3-phosphate 1-O-acyltransferase PlsY [Acidobacteriaceae bacterium]
MVAPQFLSLAVPTLLAFLIGGLPFGYWCVRMTSGKDIREMGSGNIGATNVHRTMGRKAGLVVLLLDICKGFLAVWLAAAATHWNVIAVALSIAAVMLGHCYPVFLRFKGGKAVACFIGAFLFVAPLALLAVAALFALIVFLSKYISLGSILGALMFPFVYWLVYHPPSPLLGAAVFAALLIIYRHRANIARLRAGNEHIFSVKGKAA